MATIKSYTDLEQSKKLAEILPLESADMSWVSCDDGQQKYYQAENRKRILNYEKNHWLPCWSLAALIDVLPDEFDIVKGKVDVVDDKYMCTVFIKEELVTAFSNNPIDACYDMIIRLNELKML